MPLINRIQFLPLCLAEVFLSIYICLYPYTGNQYVFENQNKNGICLIKYVIMLNFEQMITDYFLTSGF